MGHVAAPESKAGHRKTTFLIPHAIVEHLTNSNISPLDAALLFFDKDNLGSPSLMAESYRHPFLKHKSELAKLEADQLSAALELSEESNHPVSLSAGKLNCLLPEGCKVPESCNVVLFPVGRTNMRKGMVLGIKDGLLHADEQTKLQEFISAFGDAFIAKLDYDKMQQKSEEAESLISVINAVNSTMDPQQMFELIIKKAVELIPDVDGAAIVTFDAAGKNITLKAGYGYYKKLIEEQTTGFDISERVIECGSPFLISPNVEEKESSVSHSGIRSAICVPISRNNRKIGAILLESNKREDSFSEDNLPLLRAFADGVGLAISKAQSHHTLKQKYSKLEENTLTMAVAYPQLLQSEKLATVGELAGSVAHEINNPLMTIMARTDILLSKIDPRDPIYNSIDVIDKQVERISKLVQGILEFARISRSEFKPQSITQIIGESILLTENHLKNHNIVLERTLKNNLPHVLADKNKLQQVFLNLITNAAQAMDKGGALTVSTGIGADRLGNERILISFKDTGYGINMENLGRIFDSFYTTKESGTGLGLAISKRIVDEHGGSISVESAAGVGTTVTVMLPPMADESKQKV